MSFEHPELILDPEHGAAWVTAKATGDLSADQREVEALRAMLAVC